MPTTYTSNPAHRNSTPNKSQWRITLTEEENCFWDAITNNWRDQGLAWSIHRPQGTIAHLGVARDHIQQVFIAKFLGDRADDWHGFPVDHQKDERDIPRSRIILAWIEIGLLNPAKARKIMKGQPCRI